MTLEESKRDIERRTGVPAALLTGESAEENEVRAMALLAYRREVAGQKRTPQSTAERFKAWFDAQMEEEAPAPAAAPDPVPPAGYPSLKDAGEVRDLPDPRPARDKFAEWAGDQLAFDPRR